jgi:hypothetical protein
MGVCGQHHASPTLPPGKSQYPLYRRLGGPQGPSGRVWKISPLLGFDPQTIQPVASRYTDCSVPAQTYFYVFILFYISLYFAILTSVSLSVCCLVHSPQRAPVQSQSQSTVVLLYTSVCWVCAQLQHLHTGTFEPLIQRRYDVTSQNLTVFIFCAHSPSTVVLVHGPHFIWQLSFVTSHWYFATNLGGLAEWAMRVW